MTNSELMLSSFTPINLEQMDHVKLLNRIDTKYTIHENELNEILLKLSTFYDVLDIDGSKVHPYETLYFDTPDYKLYHMHHNGHRNRFKLRCRKYLISKDVFFEIKSKTNTSRTIKKRIQVAEIPQKLDESYYNYIKTHIKNSHTNYEPALQVFFDRITLVNKVAGERLTFDLNLHYKHNTCEKRISHIVIVEVKQDKNAISPFRELMKADRKHKNYLSKYCLGIISVNNEMKKNRFKQKLTALNKLGYETL